MTWNREDGKVFETLSEDISTMNSEALHIKRKAMPVVRFMIIGYNPGSDTVFLRVHESVFSYGFEDGRSENVGRCSLGGWDMRLQRFHSRSCVVASKHSLGAIEEGGRRSKGNKLKPCKRQEKLV
ncbi:hypothetical protein RHMOL_Rhmol10G0129900 [Rhododendron molle]|uniref:Uncharacterized protein n=1 Tax=Rhododendron molle TaxID=49168 RepID=A0ACC0M2P8_RHOML|nr:hypothetical protein RHMOL_Rhmol10G0129900 [Rhododendron molle]